MNYTRNLLNIGKLSNLLSINLPNNVYDYVDDIDVWMNIHGKVSFSCREYENRHVVDVETDDYPIFVHYLKEDIRQLSERIAKLNYDIGSQTHLYVYEGPISLQKVLAFVRKMMIDEYNELIRIRRLYKNYYKAMRLLRNS